MRRTLATALVSALLVSGLTTGAALAAKPATSCPATESGYFVVDVNEWWEITIDGIVAEGYSEGDDSFAQSLGFADWADLEYFVLVTQWAVIDKNGNGLGCMKVRPHTPGNPAYYFNGVDDQASTSLGDAA